MTDQNQTDEKAFLIGVINGALWNVVTAVIQPELVLSAFILRLKKLRSFNNSAFCYHASCAHDFKPTYLKYC